MDKIFEHFTITILKLNKIVQKIKQLESQKHGLKAVHIMCGYYLNEHPEGLTSTELVKLTLEDKAAISRALKTMIQQGYAEKVGARTVLTGKGKSLAEFITERSDKAVEAGSAFFTDEERVFFYKSLGEIADRLESYYNDLSNE